MSMNERELSENDQNFDRRVWKEKSPKLSLFSVMVEPIAFK